MKNDDIFPLFWGLVLKITARSFIFREDLEKEVEELCKETWGEIIGEGGEAFARLGASI